MYFSFTEKLRLVLPEDISHLFIQCVAGTFGGFTTTLITNPMDTIRARLQVKEIPIFTSETCMVDMFVFLFFCFQDILYKSYFTGSENEFDNACI